MRTLIFSLLLAASVTTVDAATANMSAVTTPIVKNSPIGTWQLTTSTKIELTTPQGKKIKSISIKGFEFATFTDDYNYISSEWLNKIGIMNGSSKTNYSPIDFYGQWYSKTIGTYNVAYDKFLIVLPDDKFGVTNLAFFDRIGLMNFVKANFKNPTSFSIQVISYSDDGSFVTGKSIKGTKKVIFRTSFKDSDIPTTTDVVLTETYTGKPAIQSICCEGDATQNAADSATFMQNVSKLQGVQTTASGLKYIVLQDNVNGKTPTSSTDTVTVNYRGFLPSGKMFDGNSSISFKLNGVISGWTEGVQLMRKGAKYRFFLPPELAYGQTGNTNIKPNSALIFDVELLAITPAAPAATTTP
jgi:hypothetical protein